MSKNKGVPAQDENELEDDELTTEETQEENIDDEGTESEESDESDDGADESTDDGDDETESEDDDGEEEEKVEKPPKKRPFKMSVSKAQKEKDKAVEIARKEAKAEAEAEMQAKFDSMRAEYEKKAANGQSTAGLDDKLTKFAEEHGLDPKAAKGLLEIFKESMPIPDVSKYEKLAKKQEIEEHKAQVKNDFDEQVAPLIKEEFPSATDAHIKKVKQEILKLAFTKRFHTYTISDIYRVNREKFVFKSGHSGEDSTGRTTETTDLANLTEDEAMKLSPTEYTAWMDLQASKQSRFR